MGFFFCVDVFPYCSLVFFLIIRLTSRKEEDLLCPPDATVIKKLFVFGRIIVFLTQTGGYRGWMLKKVGEEGFF